MNALLRKLEPTEDIHMTEDEKNQRLLGEMLSDIRHLQSDVTDIKTEQRIRFDKVDARFDKMEAQIDGRFKKLDDRFDKIDARFDKMDDRFDKMDAQLDGRFEKVDDHFGRIEKDIGAIKESLASAKVWAIGLYVALAGTMLYVMAHGFKWL